MERRMSLYINRRSFMTWFAAALLLASAVARIVVECVNGVPCAQPWITMVLPLAATVLYALIALVWGKEMFYKTAVPIWMIAAYYGFRFMGYGFGTLVNTLFWIALLFYAVIYTHITAGRGMKIFGCWCSTPALWLLLSICM